MADKNKRTGVLVGDRSRYGAFGRTVQGDKKKQQPVIPEENNPPYRPIDPNSSPTQKLVNQQTSAPTNPFQTLKDMPVLYEGEGKNRKINPNYDTSIGRDIAAGAGMAKPTGNSFYDLGAALGGAIGGGFNKNLAGKLQYEKDVEQVQQWNKDAVLKTEAYQRAEAQALARQREARLQQASDERIAINQGKAQLKNKGDMSKFLIQAAQASTSPEARQQLSEEFNQHWGIDAPADPNFGQKYKEVKVGDYLMLMDSKTGEFINAKRSDGEDISLLDTETQLDILKKWTGLSDKETPDLVSAMSTADEYISKNFKGGLKAQQYNSLKMQLTREILKMQKQGGSGKVVINGQVIPLPDLNILEQKPPLAKDSPEGNSPFMQTQPEGQTDVIDATNGQPSLNGQPPANIPRTGEKTPTAVTESDTEYPLSIVSSDGKSYATRQVLSGTENFDKKKTYLSKDKKTRLVFMDGAWYQVKLSK